MRPLLAPSLALATASLFALMAAAPRTADAAAGVARCAMPDGSHAYTNTACSSMGGKSAPLPADVLNRIQSERRYEAELTGQPLVENSLLPATAAIGERRPLAGGCAATPQQLAVDLRASMTLGDVNRIAESFDWAGMPHKQAMQVMARIEGLGELALVDAEYFDASIGMDALQDDAGGMMQVTLDQSGMRTVADFDVRRTSGCYFLRYA
jgi:hypothetical protein